MLVKCLTVGSLESNCYIVTDEKSLKCAIIDPGDETGTIMEYIEECRLDPQAVILTHGHFDHTGAADYFADEFGIPIYINRADVQEEYLSDYKFLAPPGTVFISEGDVIQAGGLKFRVIETPGHSPGSVTLRCENALFTGDALFRGSCGRTDLEGGNQAVLMNSLRRLGEIPGDYEVYPGHMGPTTLDIERATNYYLKAAMSP